MMLLDIMDNLPWLRLSTAHFKLILWLLKESGVTNVPSYNTFRKMQVELQSATGGEPKAFTSALGNHFHVNDLEDAVKRVRALHAYINTLINFTFTAEFCESLYCGTPQLLPRRDRWTNLGSLAV